MKIRFIILLLICSTSTQAQTAEDSVKAVINKLFVAMKSADGRMLVECFADSAILQTIARNKAGELSVRNEKPADFVAQISRLPKDSADERIRYDVVKTDGPLAIAWTPYQFYYAGKFSHCGVNSFQLVRLGGSWKIQYLIDTRRRTGCNE